MKKLKKAIVKSTGEKIKVSQQTGFYWDGKNGRMYRDNDLEILERKHDFQLGFHIWRIGFYFFGREYLKYNSWFIFPGISIDWVNGYDCYLDIEVKLLCVGFGVRFIWIKKWVPGILWQSLFGKRKKKGVFSDDFNGDFKRKK